MQQAADAMRRAAAGSAAQGNAALEELNRAARELEESRTDGLSEGIKQLSEQAKELRERQQEIAEDVRRCRARGAQRGRAAAPLDERKQTLANDVSRLEAETDRLSREGRREQPSAARELGEASETMREQRVQDKIEFSQSVMRGGSTEYANAFEEQISETIGTVAEQLGEARSAR